MQFAPDELVSFLKRIGWFPGRRADIELDLESWAARGYEVPGVVREFMTECCGLELE